MIQIVFLVLMHSLWQGLMLAALTGLVMLLAQRVSPAIRYRLLTGLLAVFAAGVAVTVVFTAQSAMRFQELNLLAATADDMRGVATPAGFDTTALLLAIGHYAPVIVGLWLLIAAFKTMRFAAGLRIAYQMKRQQVFEAGRHWQEEVGKLSRRMGIRRPVRILQSALAKTPLVIGHFKPVILMPLGLMSRLPVAEVEAILCHELAHIRRRDFGVNLLQAALEVLFFFNPAVLWLNKLIREEREHCCDDLAIGAHVGIGDYVRALVSSQSVVAYRPAYALSFAGTQNQLLNRVSRLLRQRDKRSRRPFRLAVLLTALLAVGAALAFYSNDGTGTRTTISRTKVENEQGLTITEQVIREAARPEADRKYCKPGIDTSTTQFMPSRQAEPVTPAAPVEPASAALPEPPAKSHAIAETYEPFTENDGRKLLAELTQDGVIGNHKEEPVSYLLNDRELIVNHVRQPAEVHQRYKSKYMQHPGRSILYNYEYTSYTSPR